VRIGLTIEGVPNITIHTNSLVNFALIAFGGWLRLSMGGDGRGKAEGTGSWLAIGILTVYFALNFIGNRLDAPPILMHATTVLGGWALLVVAQNQNSWFVRLLEIAPLLWFGRMTYGFYIYHNLVGVNTLVPLLQGLGFDVVFPAQGAAVMSFAMALATAWVSYRWFEAPIIKGGRRKPAVVALQV
jgi:peptidoglycan/LPS O-acetylase OafA/YrhL